MTVDKEIPILIVDDYKTMLRILRGLLNQLGFRNIEEATDGKTAMARLRNEAFSLVISDWGMEPMDGLQLLKTIRADEKLKKIPFIMVASDTKPEDVMKAKQAGVSNFILKPFNADTLKSKLISVLGPF
ncbi:MAG: response regulator [Alphaproteobacteria bacterium]|nr:MAG: response regulator [Alphaproteobacteria bacterium]